MLPDAPTLPPDADTAAEIPLEGTVVGVGVSGNETRADPSTSAGEGCLVEQVPTASQPPSPRLAPIAIVSSAAAGCAAILEEAAGPSGMSVGIAMHVEIGRAAKGASLAPREGEEAPLLGSISAAGAKGDAMAQGEAEAVGEVLMSADADDN